MTNLIEVFLDEPLFLDKFDIGERFCSKFDRLNKGINILQLVSLRAWMYLVKPVFTSITDIDNLDHFRRQPLVKHITLTQLGLEIRAASQHQSSAIDLIIRNKMLHGKLCHLPNIIVSFFIPQTRESKSRLSTSSMFFGKIDVEFVNDIASVAS